MARKILIIEDDQDIAHLLKLHLSDMGYETTWASDGSGGLKKALSQSFDLILLDLMLPGIDGWEIARQVRAQPTYPPLLMLTARSSEVDRVLGLEVGADDYLTKPFSIRELLARVKALFRRVDALKVSPATDSHK
jgi:DNA-binding response OmpR family regulator